MLRPVMPVDILRSATTFTAIACESQMVIAMRLLGAAGFWKLGRLETRRMLDEKTDAVSEAVIASTCAAFSGLGPLAMAEAAMAPIRRRTSANRRRLTRKGPSLPL